MFPRKDKSYDKNSLQTPKWLFNWLDSIYNFDRDAAADDSNHLCPIYNTKEDSFLDLHVESEAIFCNPPYSYKSIDKFVNHAVDLIKSECTTVFVIPTFNGQSRDETIIKYSSSLTFFDKRINFIKPDGQELDRNGRGTMIAVISPEYAIYPILDCVKRDEIKGAYK